MIQVTLGYISGSMYAQARVPEFSHYGTAFFIAECTMHCGYIQVSSLTVYRRVDVDSIRISEESITY